MQQGVVGQIVGQKVAEAKLGGFLESGAIDGLSDDSKQTLFPAVDASSWTVGTLGVQALGAVEQARQSVQAHVDKQIATVPAMSRQSPALQEPPGRGQHQARCRRPPGRTRAGTRLHLVRDRVPHVRPADPVIFPPIVRPGP